MCVSILYEMCVGLLCAGEYSGVPKVVLVPVMCVGVWDWCGKCVNTSDVCWLWCMCRVCVSRSAECLLLHVTDGE